MGIGEHSLKRTQSLQMGVVGELVGVNEQEPPSLIILYQSNLSSNQTGNLNTIVFTKAAV